MTRRMRPWIVTAAAVFMLVGTLFGIGVFGTRVEESRAAACGHCHPRCPGGPGVLDLVGHLRGADRLRRVAVVPQNNGDSPRHRSIAGLAAASAVLNAAWLLVTQVGWLWLSVAVIVALVVVLGTLVRRLTELPASGWVERVIVDGTFGLYLGCGQHRDRRQHHGHPGRPGHGSGRHGRRVLGRRRAGGRRDDRRVPRQAPGRTARRRRRDGLGSTWIAVGRPTTTPYSLTAGAALAAALAVVGAALLVRLRPARAA